APRESGGALAAGVRPMVALVARDGLDDCARDRMLARERAEHPLAEEQRLVRLKSSHDQIVLATYNDSRWATLQGSPFGLTARGESPAAFGRRCIPAGCVAPPSNIADILGRRALPSGRLAGLDATPGLSRRAVTGGRSRRLI